MQSEAAASKQAICGESLVFAYEEASRVTEVETHMGNKISGLNLNSIETKNDTISYISGRDAANVKVVFDFHYLDDKLKEVEVYRGELGSQYGVVTKVLL